MRLEYGFELSGVSVPRFSVEAVEGIGKLFTLATLVLNVLETKLKVEIVVSDTIPLKAAAAACSQIRQLSVAELLAETLRRISQGDSVSSLYLD